MKITNRKIELTQDEKMEWTTAMTLGLTPAGMAALQNLQKDADAQGREIRQLRDRLKKVEDWIGYSEKGAT